MIGEQWLPIAKKRQPCASGAKAHLLPSLIRVCRSSQSISDAGRRLFAISRLEKVKANDADRLRKYLARFDLTFAALSATTLPTG
ncbi:hypothetical protein ASD83_12780 [Devosia sp. Root685]|nr:hypothetical protein ASD83_12780 [Devosia sp. Root685]